MQDTDESTHSFVLALNNDFEGGGTYFYDSDTTIRADTGSVLSFRGDDIRHGGEPIQSGTRYILAVFLYYDDDHDTVCDAEKLKRKKSQRTESNQGATVTSFKKRNKSEEKDETSQPGFSFNFAVI